MNEEKKTMSGTGRPRYFYTFIVTLKHIRGNCKIGAAVQQSKKNGKVTLCDPMKNGKVTL
jgi:hypothetical protein